MDGTVVVDVDLRSRLILDAANGLAAWANDGTDLIGVDLNRLDARRERRKVDMWLRQRLEHLIHNEHAAFFGLRHRLRQDFGSETLDLDVHLKRCHTVRRAGDLEVHVTHGVFESLNIGENRIFAEGRAIFGDQAHGHTGDRRLDRHTGVHQAERAAAGGSHGGRSIGAEHLGDDANGVRELLPYWE